MGRRLPLLLSSHRHREQAGYVLFPAVNQAQGNDLPPNSLASPPNQGLPMEGGSTTVTPMVATPTFSAPLVGGHFTQQKQSKGLLQPPTQLNNNPEVIHTLRRLSTQQAPEQGQEPCTATTPTSVSLNDHSHPSPSPSRPASGRKCKLQPSSHIPRASS